MASSPQPALSLQPAPESKPNSSREPAQSRASSYYAFLEGLRAIAALFVVLHHSWKDTWNWRPPQRSLGSLLSVFTYGHVSVTIFITLSGFCLMLPLLRDGGESFRTAAFLRRRCIRILPPCYFAILLGLSGDWVTNRPMGRRATLEHFLMIQNWDPRAIFLCNPALWSVALEFQIYLVFPLLVWLYKRFSIYAFLAASVVIGYVLYHWTADPNNPVYYLGIFGLGATAATLAKTRPRLPLLVPLLTFTLLACYLYRIWGLSNMKLSDTVAGITTAILLAYCVQNPSAWLTRFLSLRRLIWIGTFSYSLYLVHMPIQMITDKLIISRLPWSLTALFLIRVFVIDALILGFAYVFFLNIEKPFLQMGRRGRTTVELAAKTAPHIS